MRAEASRPFLYPHFWCEVQMNLGRIRVAEQLSCNTNTLSVCGMLRRHDTIRRLRTDRRAMLSAANGSLITPAGQTAQPFNARVEGFRRSPSCQDVWRKTPAAVGKPFAFAGATSRYPRLPLGVTHAKRGAKHSAARCRVCEWQTRAGVVLVVYILHHPSVAARQSGLREQSIAPGKLSSCQSNGHLVSPWVFPATPSDRPRDAVSPIARSSPPLLAIPNFSTALLKTPVSPDGLVCSI